jgi:integrase
MKAMTLLGINCGFGNRDCGTLPLTALDLKTGWVDFPRPKTSVERKCSLWPETIEAIKEAIASQPEAKLPEHKRLAFITARGGPWAKDTAESPVYLEFRKLLDKLELRRQGVSFYALRHTFETIGGGSRDQVAVNHIMGHVDSSMAATYREQIEDARLLDVTDHVHHWLFVKKSAK